MAEINLDDVAYKSVMQELVNTLSKRVNLEKEMNDAITNNDMAAFYKAQEGAIQLGAENFKAATQMNRMSSKVSEGTQILAKFKNNVPAGKMLMLGEGLMRAGDALADFRESIYKAQAKLGTTFATATDKLVGAYVESIRSIFTTGPKVTQDEIINSINAFQNEFGRILTAADARKFAQAAKGFGTDIATFQKAQRAFLGAGGLAGQASTQQTFITQFRAAGLTANQALKFAAENANLIAIAGTKYADELARAAANATRIGVSLDKTERFADNLVGDFEGSLEKFSELRAMGVEVDFNRLAGIAATGTPEEIVGELSSQLGGNAKLLEEIQRNRFLKLAIEQDLGLSIADVKRLSGVAEQPAVQTTQEKNEQSLTTIAKFLPILIKSLGAIVSIAGLLAAPFTGGLSLTALLASIPMMFAGDLRMGPGSNKTILSSKGAIQLDKDDSIVAGTNLFGGKGSTASVSDRRDRLERANGVLGVAGKVATEAAAAGASLRRTVNMITGVGDVIAGGMVAYDTYKQTNNLQQSISRATGYVGASMLGGLLGAVATGPAAIAGEAVGSSAAGEAYLSSTAPSAGRLTLPAPSLRAQADTTTVSRDTTNIEKKLDRVVSAISNMRVTMDANTVGKIVANSSSPIDLATA